MIPGPYAVAHATLADESSDAITYRTLKWGYDNAATARLDLTKVASEAGLPLEEVCVIKHVDEDDE